MVGGHSRIGVFLAAAAALVVAVAAQSSPAQANFKICNSSNEKVWAAIEVDDVIGDYVYTKGWWGIEDGACVTATSEDISDLVVAIYAYAPGNSDRWSGDDQYCVDPNDRFEFKGRWADNCDDSDKRGFRFVNTGTYSNYTYTLHQ